LRRQAAEADDDDLQPSPKNYLTYLFGILPKNLKKRMNGFRRNQGITLDAVMKDNHLKERKAKVREG